MRLHKTAWTEEDIRRLREHIESGGSPARASAIFRRSIGAVQTQARKMGAPFPSTRAVRRDLLARTQKAELTQRHQ